MRGNLDESFLLYQEVVSALGEVLGEEHPSQLTAKRKLGNIAMKRGDYSAASSRLLFTLAKQREISGPHHPDTLATLSSLCYTEENYVTAERYFEEARVGQIDILGQFHKETMLSFHNISKTRLNLEKSQKQSQ